MLGTGSLFQRIRKVTYIDANITVTQKVEFMGENQRYHDLRRWKNVAIEESEQIYGCNVLMTEATKERFYERVRVENLQANFSRKMYFWPILERELQWNRRMTQAPGWETFD